MPPEIAESEVTTHEPTEKEVAQHPRMLAMEAIKVKRDDDDEPPADDQLALQSTDAPQKMFADDKALVKVKVDGVEQEVTVADAVANYQRAAAAQTRLNEATRLLEEARRTAAATKPPAAVDEVLPRKDTAPHQPSAETLGEFVDTLFEGDKDKAVAALAKLGLMGRAESPTLPDLAQLEEQLTPVIRQRLIDDSALERFEKDNADLAADPHLVSVTNGFIQQAVDGGKSYAQALSEGAKRTRDWLTAIGAAKPAPTPEPGAHQPSKLERKASIDEVQALNRTANTTQTAPESPSQVIAAMRKARGQE